MTKQEISTNPIHTMPADFKKILSLNPAAKAAWERITPLARNEWICWVTIVKKSVTRKEHIERACAELAQGERRPCCWPGCPHRRPKAAKWFRPKLPS